MLLTDRVGIKCEGWSTDKAKYLAEKSRDASEARTPGSHS